METKTAGFWIRALAQLIDAALISLLLFLPLSGSREKMMLGQVLTFFLTYSYFYYFYISRGQTVGKILTGIRVERVDGSPITFKTVTLRKIVDLGFSLVRTAVMCFSLMKMSDAAFDQIVKTDPSTSMYKVNPILLGTTIGMIAWIIIDTLVLLAHSQKRSLHDLMAGTIVRYVKKAVVPAATSSILFIATFSQASPKRIEVSDLGMKLNTNAAPTQKMKTEKTVVGRCDGKDFTDMAALESCQSGYALMQSGLKPILNANSPANSFNPNIAVPNIAMPNVAVPTLSMPAASMPAIR